MLMKPYLSTYQTLSKLSGIVMPTVMVKLPSFCFLAALGLLSPSQEAAEQTCRHLSSEQMTCTMEDARLGKPWRLEWVKSDHSHGDTVFQFQ